MDIKEALINARELIVNGWTQSYSARDSYGNFVSATDPNAKCFCTLGALERVVLHDEEFFIELYDYFKKANNLESYISVWNDAPKDVGKWKGFL